MAKFRYQIVVDCEVKLSRRDVREAFEHVKANWADYKKAKKVEPSVLLEAAKDLDLIDLPEMGDSVDNEIVSHIIVPSDKALTLEQLQEKQ